MSSSKLLFTWRNAWQWLCGWSYIRGFVWRICWRTLRGNSRSCWPISSCQTTEKNRINIYITQCPCLNNNNYMLSLALPLHWLTEGVFTLHTPGSCRARVWLMVIPSPAPPLLRAAQRHCGWDWTTLASCEQQEDDGVEEFPEMKFRHGAKPISTLVQPDWAMAPGQSSVSKTRARPIWFPLVPMQNCEIRWCKRCCMVSGLKLNGKWRVICMRMLYRRIDTNRYFGWPTFLKMGVTNI